MKFCEWPLEMFVDGNEYVINKKCVETHMKERSKLRFQELVFFENWRSIVVKVYALYLRGKYGNDSENTSAT